MSKNDQYDKDNINEVIRDVPVAVALEYDSEVDQAPRVIAGGHGSIAEQILEIAFNNGIKVREDADLAELLSSIDLQSEVPPEAFAIIAEILVYMYRANGNWPAFLDDAFGGSAPNRYQQSTNSKDQ